MQNDIVEQTARKLQMPIKILFSFAYFYVEVPSSRNTSNTEYEVYCRTGRYSVAVEQLCLDTLSGRVSPVEGMPAIEAFHKALEMMKGHLDVDQHSGKNKKA